MSILTKFVGKLRRKKSEVTVPSQGIVLDEISWSEVAERTYRQYEELSRQQSLMIHDNYVASDSDGITIDGSEWLHLGNASSLPHCFICNRLVDNEEAISDAELLEKYTGRDSGILCCNCFKVAKTIIDGEEVKQNAET